MEHTFGSRYVLRATSPQRTGRQPTTPDRL